MSVYDFIFQCLTSKPLRCLVGRLTLQTPSDASEQVRALEEGLESVVVVPFKGVA